MAHEIEVFYTGGGITLVEAAMNLNRYGVVTSEAPAYLTIYNRTENEPYLPEDMVMSLVEADMDAEVKNLYTQMLEKLNP